MKRRIPLHHSRSSEHLAFAWHLLGMGSSSVLAAGGLISFFATWILWGLLDIAVDAHTARLLAGAACIETVIGFGGILWHTFGAIEHWKRLRK